MLTWNCITGLIWKNRGKIGSTCPHVHTRTLFTMDTVSSIHQRREELSSQRRIQRHKSTWWGVHASRLLARQCFQRTCITSLFLEVYFLFGRLAGVEVVAVMRCDEWSNDWIETVVRDVETPTRFVQMCMVIMWTIKYYLSQSVWVEDTTAEVNRTTSML